MKVAKVFDMCARTYDRTEEKRFAPIHRKVLQNTQPYLQENDIVLDFGCATGTKTLEFAGKVKKVYGIDISSKMIAAATRKAAQRQIENVEFSHATIFDERYPKGSFDVILAFAILHLLEDDRGVLQRITGLLKPGGLLISTTPCLGETMATWTQLQFSFFRLLIQLRLFPPIRRYQFPELEALITSGNLHIIKTEHLFHELSSYFIVAKKG